MNAMPQPVDADDNLVHLFAIHPLPSRRKAVRLRPSSFTTVATSSFSPSCCNRATRRRLHPSCSTRRTFARPRSGCANVRRAPAVVSTRRGPWSPRSRRVAPGSQTRVTCSPTSCPASSGPGPRPPPARRSLRPRCASSCLAAYDTRTGPRDLAIIHLLLDTGMRVGGLCSILAADLDLRDRRGELRLKGTCRQVVYFGSPDRRDGGRTTRALKSYVAERHQLLQRQATDHSKGHLFLSFDGWPLTPGGVRGLLKRLGEVAKLKNVYPHKFRHTFASLYLVRHPGDETGLRGALGHLSSDQFRTYTHIASEIIAQRAGRVSLSEAWLGEDGAT